jgi:hypothetical protein
MKYLIVITYWGHLFGERLQYFANVYTNYCDRETVEQAVQKVKEKAEIQETPIVLNIIKLGD